MAGLLHRTTSVISARSFSQRHDFRQILAVDTFQKDRNQPYSLDMLTWLLQKATIAFMSVKLQGITRQDV